MNVCEPHPLLAKYARVLIPSVLVGLGLERMLVGGGIAPWQPTAQATGMVLAGAFELAGGLLLWIGWRVRLVATAMALFVVVQGFMVHPFWSAAPGALENELWLFLGSISSCGGLLLLAAVHPRHQARHVVRARENVRLHRGRAAGESSD